ncbi:MAG: hypothetical protein FWG10_02690 [Eubacteriaceae bacterium]|nr:hypothetical protein [Eubacteriaceae bacterium]
MIKDKTPLLVGGLPYFKMAVALYPGDNGEIGNLAVIAPHAADWESLGLERTGSNMVFDYAEIKSIVNALPRQISLLPSEAGGGVV